MSQLGKTVAYMPHAAHDVSDRPGPYAATVGHLHDDGSADLYVMAPGKPAFWAERVPEGDGPHSFAEPKAARKAKPAA